MTKDVSIRSSAAEYLTFVAATGDDKNSVEVRYEDENIWITQKMMATLYEVDVRTINYHILKIFEDSELQEDSVIRNFRITASDGKSYDTKHYSLQMIIAVGFKVNSARAVQFRKWINQIAKDYTIKGWVLDSERLKNGGSILTKEIALTKNNEFQNIVLMIKQAQIRAYSAVNHELIDLYFSLGKYISVKVEQSNWGKGVVKELADYIAKTAPELTGFSDKNLWRMKQFYETYKDDEKLSPLVRELSWTNNLIIFSRTKSAEERAFYLKKSLQEKYTKRELERQIDSNLYESTVHNGLIVSPAVQELVPNAQEIFRDTYTLEFLGLPPKHDEKDLRKALVRNMKQFILELGKDFIFIDEEYRVQVGNSDFFIDLLFYHRELQCLVAFELKTGKFEPEHLGQLNFYLEALDRDVKKEKENPSIGILLCRDKDDDVVEYALSRSLSPAMIAEYKLHLPDKKVLQQRIKTLLENTEV